MKLDVLVFGPHPDDAEIGAGGLLLKLKALGHRTGIVDMTHGDMGWGTPQERDRECDEAAKILKLDLRMNLDLPDFRVEDPSAPAVRLHATPTIVGSLVAHGDSLRAIGRGRQGCSTRSSPVTGATRAGSMTTSSGEACAARGATCGRSNAWLTRAPACSGICSASAHGTSA